MSNKNLSAKVQTVLGQIDEKSLGPTLVHEHILDELHMYAIEPHTEDERKLLNSPLTLDNLYLINLNPFSNLDNLRFNDEALAVKEALIYKSFGGRTIIDVTTDSWMGRNPQGLVRIARQTGLNIVMGTGYYMAAAHDSDISSKTEPQIAQEFINEIQTGVGDTGIKAGIIGEIGCSLPLTDPERKVLRSCAIAQRQTGAAIYIHPGPSDDVAWEIVQVLKAGGAELSRVIIGHVDLLGFSTDILLKIMNIGCYIAYDNFGNEGFFQLPHAPRPCEPNDVRRVNDIVQFAREGYLDHILVSQDVATKERLTSYGGTGYAHILRDIVPIMRIKGLTDAQIQTLLVENPRRILSLIIPT